MEETRLRALLFCFATAHFVVVTQPGAAFDPRFLHTLRTLETMRTDMLAVCLTRRAWCAFVDLVGRCLSLWSLAKSLTQTLTFASLHVSSSRTRLHMEDTTKVREAKSHTTQHGICSNPFYSAFPLRISPL